MYKLELKHLAPYLPYKLMVNVDIWNEELVGYTYEADGKHRVQILIKKDKKQKKITYYTPQLEHVKPILRLLSDLTDTTLKFSKYTNEQTDNFKNGCEYGIIETLPYSDIITLFENHFDVFGLIEKGLAIDINTI